MEKVTEKFEMGLDAQKRFAQMYEDRHMHKRIGSKMMKLDPIIIQKSRKEIELGRLNPRSKYEKNPMILPVFSYERVSPNTGRHWITDSEAKKPCFTKDSKSDLEHLLGSQPSSRVGSAAVPFLLVVLLGAIRKSTDRFTRINWRKP